MLLGCPCLTVILFVVKITTAGFEKAQEEKQQTKQPKRKDHFDVGSEELWELGERISK
jgi:hypothetical protein